jgi:hypothetical protein
MWDKKHWIRVLEAAARRAVVYFWQKQEALRNLQGQIDRGEVKIEPTNESA